MTFSTLYLLSKVHKEFLYKLLVCKKTHLLPGSNRCLEKTEESLNKIKIKMDSTRTKMTFLKIHGSWFLNKCCSKIF